MVNGSDSRPSQTSSSQTEQEAVGLDPAYTDLKNPDFGEVAQVMGIWGRSVSKADGIYTDRRATASRRGHRLLTAYNCRAGSEPISTARHIRAGPNRPPPRGANT